MCVREWKLYENEGKLLGKADAGEEGKGIFGPGLLVMQNGGMISGLSLKEKTIKKNMQFEGKQGLQILDWRDRWLLLTLEGKFCLVSMDDGKEYFTAGAGGDLKGKLTDDGCMVLYDGRDTAEIRCLDQKGALLYRLPVLEELSDFSLRKEKDGFLLALGYGNGVLEIRDFSDEREKKLLLKEKASQSGIQLVEWLEDGSLALGLGDGIIRTFYIDKEEGEAKQQTEWKLGIFCRGVRTLGLIPEEIRRLLEEHAAGSE